MLLPIIEIRNNNLFVLKELQGFVIAGEMVFPYNRFRNLTKYIIDSSGSVYELTHIRHNNSGLRKVISPILNISKDIYSFTIYKDRTVTWLLGVLSSMKPLASPDLEGLRAALVSDLKEIDGDAPLESAISGLNL